jgi:hypothetical protein
MKLKMKVGWRRYAVIVVVVDGGDGDVEVVVEWCWQ